LQLNKKKKAAKKAKAEPASGASSVAAATPSLDELASPRASVDAGDERCAQAEPDQAGYSGAAGLTCLSIFLSCDSGEQADTGGACRRAKCGAD
jgi:hypothetical protein